MSFIIIIAAAIAILVFSNGEMAKRLYISDLMGISWGALAGCFLAPFLYGLYWKKTTSAACWTSFLFSTVVMLANMLAKPIFPVLLQSPINAGVFCMLAGLIIVPVVSLMSNSNGWPMMCLPILDWGAEMLPIYLCRKILMRNVSSGHSTAMI